MPYKDPEKKRAADRTRLQLKKQDATFRTKIAATMRERRPVYRATERGVPGSPARAVYQQGRREQYRRKETSLINEKVFLAYDGEAVQGRYVLLANTRENVVNMDGLTTEECLEFLTRDYDDKPIRVIFASDYDVTMCLLDLPTEKLDELAHRFRTYWTAPSGQSYTISHYPGKILRINRKGGGSYVYYDVWGFFQKSFLATVDEYKKVGLVLNDEDNECLEWGKAARVGFTKRDLKRMVRYNHIECTLLEAIMLRLRIAVNSAGMRPTMWHGPGVLAEIFLDRARSQRYLEKGFQNVALRRSYFGGRIEVLQRGVIDGPVYDYDIHSAYPFALASFTQARAAFFDIDRFVPGTVGLYSVSWNLPESTVVGPFPYRAHDGSIHFPPRGRGIYHAIEVAAAIEAYGLAESSELPGVYVERGRIAEPGETPFRTLVEQWYEKREEYKRRGDITQIAYKLGLNSAYGKLAQRVGKRKYADMYLAGFITAYTRALLLRAFSGPCGGSIIAFATDGILARQKLPSLALSDAIGDYEFSEYDGVDVLMSGIYRLHKGDENYSVKSRGWAQLDFDAAMTTLDERAPVGGFEVKNHAFVTYRMAINFPEAYGPLLGRFIDRHRYLSPETEQKRLWRLDAEEGPTWTRAPQHSIARPLERDGVALLLEEIEASGPIADAQAPSEDVWIVSKQDAEAAYMVDADGLPMAVQ